MRKIPGPTGPKKSGQKNKDRNFNYDSPSGSMAEVIVNCPEITHPIGNYFEIANRRHQA